MRNDLLSFKDWVINEQIGAMASTKKLPKTDDLLVKELPKAEVTATVTNMKTGSTVKLQNNKAIWNADYQGYEVTVPMNNITLFVPMKFYFTLPKIEVANSGEYVENSFKILEVKSAANSGAEHAAYSENDINFTRIFKNRNELTDGRTFVDTKVEGVPYPVSFFVKFI